LQARELGHIKLFINDILVIPTLSVCTTMLLNKERKNAEESNHGTSTRYWNKLSRKGKIYGDALLLKGKDRRYDDVKGMTRSGKIMDIKTMAHGGRIDIKAIKSQKERRLVDIKALFGSKNVAVKAFGKDGKIYDVKGLPYADNPRLRMRENSIGRVKAFRSAPVLARKLRR